MGWVGEEWERPDVLALILPTLACIPVKVREFGLPGWRECTMALHSAIKELAERHHVLSGEVILAFGKECTETQDHPLAQMAGLLQGGIGGLSARRDKTLVASLRVSGSLVGEFPIQLLSGSA